MHAKSALEFMTDNTANEQDQNAGNSRVAEYLSTKKRFCGTSRHARYDFLLVF